MKVPAILAAGLLSFPFASVSAQSVNDAQIASIVVTANQVDIDAGKLAESTVDQRQVKDVCAVDGHRPYRRQQVRDRSRDEAQGDTRRTIPRARV